MWLGPGLATRRLHPEGRLRAIAAIERFVNMAQVEVPQLTLIVTAAVRSASDGLSFCNEIKRKTGKEINIIDGLEEARLRRRVASWPGAYGLFAILADHLWN